MKIKKVHSFKYNPRHKKEKEILTRYSPDFTKLRIKFVPEIQNGWAGDWDLRTNTIKIHQDLDDVDKYGVVIHEFIEMMVTSLMGIPGFPHPDYDQEVHGELNQLAHDLANKIEKQILELANVEWVEHEKRVNKVRNKRSKNEMDTSHKSRKIKSRIL